MVGCIVPTTTNGERAMTIFVIIATLRKLLDHMPTDGLTHSTLELCIFWLEEFSSNLAEQDNERNNLVNTVEDYKWKLDAAKSDCAFYLKEIDKLKAQLNPEVKAKLTECLNAEAGKHNIGIPEQFFTTIIDCLMRDSLIMAIKELRTITNWGLKDSKDFIENVCWNAGTRQRPNC